VKQEQVQVLGLKVLDLSPVKCHIFRSTEVFQEVGGRILGIAYSKGKALLRELASSQ
jgi:hypothetical protein